MEKKDFKGGSGFKAGPPKIDLKSKKTQIEDWVKRGIDKNTVEFAEVFGEQIAKDELSSSQIRNVFGEMRRIQMNKFSNEKSSFILLKPKLAYAAKRQGQGRGNDGIMQFYDFFKMAYDAVDTSKDDLGTIQFENMLQLMEAVLAYHKFYNGK